MHEASFTTQLRIALARETPAFRREDGLGRALFRLRKRSELRTESSKPLDYGSPAEVADSPEEGHTWRPAPASKHDEASDSATTARRAALAAAARSDEAAEDARQAGREAQVVERARQVSTNKLPPEGRAKYFAGLRAVHSGKQTVIETADKAATTAALARVAVEQSLDEGLIWAIVEEAEKLAAAAHETARDLRVALTSTLHLYKEQGTDAGKQTPGPSVQQLEVTEQATTPSNPESDSAVDTSPTALYGALDSDIPGLVDPLGRRPRDFPRRTAPTNPARLLAEIRKQIGASDFRRARAFFEDHFGLPFSSYIVTLSGLGLPSELVSDHMRMLMGYLDRMSGAQSSDEAIDGDFESLVRQIIRVDRPAPSPDLQGREDFSGQDLSGENFHGRRLLRAVFRRATLDDAILSEAVLDYSNFEEASLIRTNFAGATMRYAQLENANLLRADLRGADLRYAKLRGANLAGTDIRGANLGGVDVELEAFDGARADETTTLPNSVIESEEAEITPNEDGSFDISSPPRDEVGVGAPLK